MLPTPWSTYARRLADDVLTKRRERVRRGLSTFGRKESYARLPQVIESTRPGRQAFIRFEQCRAALLDRLSKSPSFRMRLNEDQVRLFDVMRDTLLPRFYGDYESMTADLHWLQTEWGIKEPTNAASIVCPRRFGKSFIESLVAVCLMLSKPGAAVYQVNMNFNQAKEWIDYAWDWLGLMREHPEFGWTEVKHQDGRQIRIRQVATGAESFVKSYGGTMNASTAQNLRGSGNLATLIIWDEGYFYCEEAYRVLVPTTANGAAVVIASSSPPSSSSALGLSKAADKDGNLLMRNLDWRRQCPICKRAEERSGVEVYPSFTPPWIPWTLTPVAHPVSRLYAPRPTPPPGQWDSARRTIPNAWKPFPNRLAPMPGRCSTRGISPLPDPSSTAPPLPLPLGKGWRWRLMPGLMPS